MELGYLMDHEEFIPCLVRWHHSEWSYLRPGESLEERETRLRGYCGRRQIPTVIISFSGTDLLGSALLLPSDMDTRKELSPWLAGVFVAPNQRRKGIGAALVSRIIEEAQSLNVSTLYLYTPDKEQFYSRRGWSVMDRTVYRKTSVVVMSHGLAAQPHT